MRAHALCLFALGLAPIVHGKKNHIDIQTLDLTPADTSADGNLLECNADVELGPGTSFVIQTPRYPRRYPNGPKGRCGWHFYLPNSDIDILQNTTINMVCDQFKVKRGDRLCIEGELEKKCYYGKQSESFTFPLDNASIRINPEPDYEVDKVVVMDFRSNKRKNSRGFRFVKFALISISI